MRTRRENRTNRLKYILLGVLGAATLAVVGYIAINPSYWDYAGNW